ncbi:glycine betaine ABC transporter substrate-binding protein [Mesorhizobium sp. VK22B]|uniref:Glycine betaine ABC transporter substrate-binding protein n=1 Tax=Mesorhizobium captivum TaxID=3072319 RepID=A0ABU4Z7R6_9HYPH|nr:MULTISPECIES: glycine betaine ABC transporter substrate-binding protein [unclassified Mesorhizobium]MDX8495332.1 glycine betaine ABC transporter substrate-binding protein [Mesorhizobium sp. VK22B]MDX8508739.1 glycine betaine ABC transporter substrate-binding protein [Mesorhizobium sp. VK22E]
MSKIRCSLQKAALAALVLAVTSIPVQSRDLVIAMPNWPSGQATANILKVGLKKEFGLDADVREMGSMIAFAGLDSGEVDIHPEVWSPNLDSLIEKYVTKAGTIVLSPIGVQAWQGLCETRVTADKYGIRDISDLNDPKKTVALDTDGDGSGELWIGAQTWASTAIERIRANSYGYAKTMTLLEMPEDVGMAAVDAAEATDRPMVFACYAPHYIFKLHDIVRLTEPPYDRAKWKIVLPSEDPLWLSKSRAPVAWNAAHFHVGYATSLRQSHPEVVKFLEHVDLKEDEISEMGYALQVERQAPFAFATQWVATHGVRVHGWAGK